MFVPLFHLNPLTETECIALGVYHLGAYVHNGRPVGRKLTITVTVLGLYIYLLVDNLWRFNLGFQEKNIPPKLSPWFSHHNIILLYKLYVSSILLEDTYDNIEYQF